MIFVIIYSIFDDKCTTLSYGNFNMHVFDWIINYIATQFNKQFN